MSGLSVTVYRDTSFQFKKDLVKYGGDVQEALQTAANMAASMMKTKAKDDISAAGSFGPDWSEDVNVSVEGTSTLGNMKISMTLNKPGANIFEYGGTISGRPLLWLPIGKAPRIAENSESLFSIQGSRHPLLVSRADRTPRYFGIPSVTIPQKFHLREIRKDVMSQFRSFFARAIK